MRGISRSGWAVVCVLVASGCGQGRTSDQCSGRVEVRSKSDVQAIEGCARIDGDLWISQSNLETLAGLERLESVRYLAIGGNDELVSLAGLRLREAEGVTLWNNPRLVDVEPLGAIDRPPTLAVLTGNALSPEALTRLGGAVLSEPASDERR